MAQDKDYGDDPGAGNLPAKYCSGCGKEIRARAEICPHCGVRQPGFVKERHLVVEDSAEVRDFTGKKIAAGICGILLGSLGVHKFILGLTTPGIIMLVATIVTCGFGAAVTHVIGLVEGIIYLTKSDEDFYRLYAVEKKGWF